MLTVNNGQWGKRFRGLNQRIKDRTKSTKWFIFLGLFVTSFNLLGDVAGGPSDAYNGVPLQDINPKLVRPVPQVISYEDRRWLFPPMYQIEFDNQMTKGKYLLIRDDYEDNLEFSFKFKNGVNSKDTFSFNNYRFIKKNGHEICRHDFISESKKRQSAKKCERYKCIPTQEPVSIKPMEQAFLKINSYEPCDVKVFWFRDTYEIGSTAILYDEISKDLTKLTKIMDGQEVEVDTSICLNKRYRCELRNRDKSPFERAWMNHEAARISRRDNNLNNLIRELLPCVKKKDTACAKKFISDPKFRFTDEIWKELEACLSYDSILPYGGRLKGIKKACFQAGDHTLYGVALPEAYSRTHDFYYVDEKTE